MNFHQKSAYSSVSTQKRQTEGTGQEYSSMVINSDMEEVSASFVQMTVSSPPAKEHQQQLLSIQGAKQHPDRSKDGHL